MRIGYSCNHGSFYPAAPNRRTEILIVRRQVACTTKRLCLTLAALVLCGGCWEEIRYNPPPEKSATPAATVANGPQTGADANVHEPASDAADQQAP